MASSRTWLRQGWGVDGWINTGDLSLSDPGLETLCRRCLRVEGHLGRNTGGGFIKWVVIHRPFPPFPWSWKLRSRAEIGHDVTTGIDRLAVDAVVAEVTH